MDLTGFWINITDGGSYYIQSVSDVDVWWVGLSGDGLQPGVNFANVFFGTITGEDVIEGDWADVPRNQSAVLGFGTLALKIQQSNGVPAVLTQTSQSGGFAGQVWRRQSKGAGAPRALDDVFGDVRKNRDNYEDTWLSDSLTAYKDHVALQGRLVLKADSDSEGDLQTMTLGWPADRRMDYGSFICFGNDPDGDMNFNLQIDPDRLPPSFWSQGWEPDISAGDVRAKLEHGDEEQRWKIHCEQIMWGKGSGCGNAEGASLLPGTADWGGNSVLLNGHPLEIQSIANRKLRPLTGPSWAVDALVGHPISLGARARVIGPIVLDCGHRNIGNLTDPCEEGDSSNNNVEIHPVYELQLFDAAGVPDLTGAWADSGAGTLYAHEVGDLVWAAWLPAFRDASPPMAFRGRRDALGVIEGSWQQVGAPNGAGGQFGWVPLSKTRFVINDPLVGGDMEKIYDAAGHPSPTATIERVPSDRIDTCDRNLLDANAAGTAAQFRATVLYSSGSLRYSWDAPGIAPAATQGRDSDTFTINALPAAGTEVEVDLTVSDTLGSSTTSLVFVTTRAIPPELHALLERICELRKMILGGYIHKPGPDPELRRRAREIAEHFEHQLAQLERALTAKRD
jgi:hypothetical protein